MPLKCATSSTAEYPHAIATVRMAALFVSDSITLATRPLKEKGLKKKDRVGNIQSETGSFNGCFCIVGERLS